MAMGPQEFFVLPRKDQLAGIKTPTNLHESANDVEDMEQEEGQTASINLMDAHKR